MKVFFYDSVYSFTWKGFIRFQPTCSALLAVKSFNKALAFRIAFIDWGLDLVCLLETNISLETHFVFGILLQFNSCPLTTFYHS